MKAFQYIQSLLPSISKDTVIEDIALTKSILEESVIPAYATATECFKGWKVKSPEVENIFKVISRTVDLGRGNVINGIYDLLPVVVENLEYISKNAQKILNEEVSASGFSYKRANILQLVEGASFLAKYASKLLVYVFVGETHATGGEESIRQTLTPIEVAWITQNVSYFAKMLAILSNKPNTVQAQLEGIPDIIVNKDNAEVLPSTLGEHKVDPFRMGFIPVFLNPIYHIRMSIAEWQADRYNRAKDELELVRLRRVRLEKQAQGNADAHLQKEIDYVERRIQSLDAKIAKMEKDYG